MNELQWLFLIGCSVFCFSGIAITAYCEYKEMKNEEATK